MQLATLLRCAAWDWGQRGAPFPLMALACLGCLALALLARQQARGPEQGPERGPERRFWGWAALLLALLAVNAALDVLAALTAAGRCLWQLQGWYGARAGWQAGLAAGLMLAGVGAVALPASRLPARLLPAILGLAGLGLLAGLRLVGLHGLDGWLARHGPGLDLAGLALVAGTAAVVLRGRKGYPPPPDQG